MTFFQVKRNISNRLCVVFSRTLASAGKEIKDNFLKALAVREEANRSGKMTVSTLLQHSNCYVMGFPSNISTIPLGWEQNLYCVKFAQIAPSTSLNSISGSMEKTYFYQLGCPTFPRKAYIGLYMPQIIYTSKMAQIPLVCITLCLQFYYSLYRVQS